MSALLGSLALAALILAAMHWPLWLAIPAGVVLYVAHSLYRPYARCWWCRGSPRYASSSGSTWRKCFVCGGKGERTRIGKKWFDGVRGK